MDQRYWISLTCAQCGTGYVTRRIWANRRKSSHCSTACSYKARQKNEVRDFNDDRFYLDHRGYYASATTGRLLHRVIWEEVNGPVPSGHVVHHENHDKSDNRIGNLALMTRGEHTTHHMTGSHPVRAKAVCRECGSTAKARGLCNKHYQRELVTERKLAA